MSHIHTEPGQHDPTVSAFLFRTDFDEPKLMLHRHKLLDRYLQFGGHIELNETPWHAIIHELREEAGYDIEQVQVLQPKERLRELPGAVLHPQPVVQNTHRLGKDHFHTDISYAMITNQEPRYSPEEGESTDIQLFTRLELEALGEDMIIPNVKYLALYILDHCIETWEPVSPSAFE
jgi:8-oxo-dGTP pyrophosphatase MutT (NUDIX family)